MNRFVMACLIVMCLCPMANSTQGRVRSSSICTVNGVTYGQHGDGHWHRVVKKEGRWYAVGNSLGKNNPCR